MTRPLAVRLAALAAAFAATHAAAINKCVDKNGKVSYQETECPKDDKAQTIRTPTSPAAEPEQEAAPAKDAKASRADDDKDDPKMLMMVSTLAHHEMCALDPSFNEKHGAVFNNWRSRNKELLARLDRSPKYQELLEQMRKQVGAKAAGSPDKFTQFCDASFAPAVAKNYAK